MKILKDIRQAIYQRLVDAAIPGVEGIYKNRFKKHWPDKEVVLTVYDLDTGFNGKDRQPRWMQGEIQIVVEVIVQGEKQGPGGPGSGDIIDVSDQMDDIGEYVVNTIIYPWDDEIGASSQGPLDGLADDIWIDNIKKAGDGDGEVVKGSQAISFIVKIQSLLPNEEAYDEFLRLKTEIKTPPDAHAEDLDIETNVEFTP